MNKKLVVGITGVCGGIGKELLKEFANRDYFVIGLDINKKLLEDLERDYRGEFKGYYCDLANRSAYQDVLNLIKDDFGAPEIWINNAGIALIKSFMEHKDSEYEGVMQINFLAVEQATRFWLSHMNEGKIVNMASVAGIVSAPMLSSYCASKFAVVGLTKSLQRELEIKQSKIKLILVCPGFIDTDMIGLGEERGLPEGLTFLVSKPKNVAKKIVTGIIKGKNYIDPTFNGKIFTNINRFVPKVMDKIQVFVTPSKWKEDLKKK